MIISSIVDYLTKVKDINCLEIHNCLVLHGKTSKYNRFIRFLEIEPFNLTNCYHLNMSLKDPTLIGDILMLYEEINS